MPASRSEELPLRSGADVVKVRQVVRIWAAEMGFSLVDQTKLVTGASELARNTLDHGRGGSVRLEIMEDGGRRGLGMTFEDRGPGIPNINLALTDGYTTGNGLGLGLSGTRRLMTEFRIDSEPGRGTRVYCARWR
ncbi:MAG: anti-sigma regulatory factor [Gemmatimonadales bacterium]|jgi:serine/threonine-protein kinase RsbT